MDGTTTHRFSEAGVKQAKLHTLNFEDTMLTRLSAIPLCAFVS